MSCFGCNNNTDHVDLSHTWSKSGSLTRDNWMPFNHPNTKEGYCSSPYNLNNVKVVTDVPTLYTGNTQCGKIKEKFEVGSRRGDYSTLDNTWGKWSSNLNQLPKISNRVGI